MGTCFKGKILTLKGFGTRRTLSGFVAILAFYPQGSRQRSNPGLKLANAFGVIMGHRDWN
jgi:hypothetical protein